MSVPKYAEFYNAFLDSLSQGETVSFKDVKEYIAQKMELTEDQLSERSGSGGALWENRVGWCATYLKNAGLVNKPKNGWYQISEEGKNLLAEGIIITDDVLMRYPSFVEFKKRNSKKTGAKKSKTFAKPAQKIIEAEKEADFELINSFQEMLPVATAKDKIKEGPREKPSTIMIHGRKAYPRNRATAVNALARASYACEIDAVHPTFLRRSSENQYTEPHHLVPMAYQDQFAYSLDIEENIVSLCCTCHKEIHYGAEAKELVKKLFRRRRTELESAGIKITLEQLINMY